MPDIWPGSEQTQIIDLNSNQILNIKKNNNFIWVTTLLGMFRIQSNIWNSTLYKNSPQLKTSAKRTASGNWLVYRAHLWLNSYSLNSDQILEIKNIKFWHL